MLFKPEEFENASFSFYVDGKQFENGALRKNNGIMMWFPWLSFPQTEIQKTEIQKSCTVVMCNAILRNYLKFNTTPWCRVKKPQKNLKICKLFPTKHISS